MSAKTPTGYATSVDPAELWAMAYVYPNPDQYVVGHVTGSTRSFTWDKVLDIMYLAVRYDNGERVYSVNNKVYSRHSAIRRLRDERGVRVIRVKVVPV